MARESVLDKVLVDGSLAKAAILDAIIGRLVAPAPPAAGASPRSISKVLGGGGRRSLSSRCPELRRSTTSSSSSSVGRAQRVRPVCGW